MSLIRTRIRDLMNRLLLTYMNIWLVDDVLAFATSVILTGILIPQILLIAFRKQLFDNIDERKIHQGTVPRLGGIAFMPAVLFSVTIILGLNFYFNTPNLHGDDAIRLLEKSVVPLCFIICGNVLLYLTGLADDLIGVKYRAKFVVQIISSVLLICAGIYITDLHGFLWLDQIPTLFGSLLTILLMVYIINAINLIDGIDGLASGLSAIALTFYGIIFYNTGDYIYSLIAFADLGTLLPFFYFNVFGNAGKRTKIFMGDTGALTTGFILALLAIEACKLTPADESTAINPIVLGYSPLIIPCFDVIRVYLRRLRKGHNPFLPDKSHIHHKLLALGLRQRVAMPLILLTACLFIVINLLLSPYIGPTLLLAGDGLIWILANLAITAGINRRSRRLHQPLYD